MYLRKCCVLPLVLLIVTLIIIYTVLYATCNTFALQTRADWMDPITKANALHKAVSMKTHVGYPDELLDDKKLEHLYRNLEIDADDHYNNYLHISFDDYGYLLEQFLKPVNKSDWVSRGSPVMINAYYNERENSMEFPAAIMQDIFFSHNRPQYMNYGAIGIVIGHEITHGFDHVGSYYDYKGDLVNWWEQEAAEKFEEKANCIVDQYYNYTVEELGMNLDGFFTLGENIADIGGTKVGYRAYKTWVNRNGPEKKLPGLDFTTSQLFWISAAQPWCENEKLEFTKFFLENNPHSPSEFRINGPFSIQPEFVKDFNCPAGSKMNPEVKCELW